MLYRLNASRRRGCDWICPAENNTKTNCPIYKFYFNRCYFQRSNQFKIENNRSFFASLTQSIAFARINKPHRIYKNNGAIKGFPDKERFKRIA